MLVPRPWHLGIDRRWPAGRIRLWSGRGGRHAADPLTERQPRSARGQEARRHRTEPAAASARRARSAKPVDSFADQRPRLGLIANQRGKLHALEDLLSYAIRPKRV